MSTLIGDVPRIQWTAARFVRVGDYIAGEDVAFGIVTNANYLDEIDSVTIELLDGRLWIGTGHTPLPLAASRHVAGEWNLRRSQLDAGQVHELIDQCAGMWT